MYKITALLIIASCIIASCHKTPHRELSDDKAITSFQIKLKGPVYYKGIIRKDSILVKVSQAVRLDSLVALIEYKGQSISPLPANTVDFSHPVIFTVTAEDGTSKAYTVLISKFTSVKEITGFTFKGSDNSGLQSDVDGIIQDNVISVALPLGADIIRLKPSITYKGESISPENGAISDFTNGITYAITADDKTTRFYTVLVSYNKMVFVGSADGNVYALSAATGKVQWKYNTHYPLSHVIYKNGIVYVGSSDGTFYALDAAAGTLKWKFFDQKINYSAPMVTPGVVYVSYYITRNRTGVYAIDSKTGNLIWNKKIGNNAISAPSFAGSILYVTDFDYGLCALDPATGNIKWNYYPGISTSNPAVANGTIYISGETGALIAVDANTGTFKWRYPGDINAQSAPTEMNGVVYVAEGLNVYAINGGNGSLVWNTQITEVNFAGFSSPVISEGLIFAGNYAGYLFAFDLATGVEKWRYYDSNAPSISWPQGPVGAHGMVVTDRGDNVLKAFFASTGKLIWTFTADGQLTYPCILDVEGNAFYAAASGNIN